MKKNDVVYLLKDDPINKELIYSLRTVDRNLPHNKVWFYGGQPHGVVPDMNGETAQYGSTKWVRAFSSLEMACLNDKITEDFWLFNDDFFVLKPVKEYISMFCGSLPDQIVSIEVQHNNAPSKYTLRLRDAYCELVSNGYNYRNYELHVPMLINRKKMMEIIRRFPNIGAHRSLYGNYYKVGGIDTADVKIVGLEDTPDVDWKYLSTDDRSFEDGLVGDFIRERFPNKSRFEVDDGGRNG